MIEMTLLSCATIYSGSAVVRGRADSRAVMVGDLDGSGDLPRQLTRVGCPPSGSAGSLRAGDIVISLRGNANNAAVIDPCDVDGTPLFATLDLAVIRLSDPESINGRYIATWLNLPATQAVLADSREGSAAKRLPLAPLKALRVPIPDWQRQIAIVQLAKEAAQERSLTARLAQLRFTLVNQCLAQATTQPMKETPR